MRLNQLRKIVEIFRQHIQKFKINDFQILKKINDVLKPFLNTKQYFYLIKMYINL